MKYAILDFETGTKTVYKRKANPFYNKIVAYAIKYQGSDNVTSGHVLVKKLNVTCTFFDCPRHFFNNTDILVGHNIKFDLLYIWKETWFQEWLKDGGRVFDTSIAEYLLTGQQHKYPALRDIAVNKYGCKEREKYMEEYWDNGIDTIDIPIDLVLKDVESDVLDTEKVMLQQVKELRKQGMYGLAMEMMEGLLATTEMEHNGMYIQREKLQDMENMVKKDIEERSAKLLGSIKGLWPDSSFNLFSNQQVSQLLFGGTVKLRLQEDVLNDLGYPVLIKSGPNKGQPRRRYTEKLYKVDGFELEVKPAWLDRRTQKVRVDEKTLSKIKSSLQRKGKDDRNPAIFFIEDLLEIRKLKKILGTYCTGLLELVYTKDSSLHGSINCTGTDTGRTSSSKPNLQNIPN